MATCQDIDQTLAQIQASHALQIARLEAKIDGCCAKSDDALNKALQALSDIAGIVSDVQQALSAIATISQTLQALQGVVAGGAAAVAALTATVANLVITVGAITVLGGRIDALESGLSQVSADLSNAYGLIQSLRNYVDGRLQELYELFSFQFNSLLTEVYRLNAELRVRIDTCCQRIDDFLNPNNPNSPNNPVNQQCCNDIKTGIENLTTKIDNITNTTNNTGGQVQNMAIQIPALVASISAIAGLVTTILGLINSIRDFLFPKPEPLTEQQTRDILDSYFPQFAGTVSGSDCFGTVITKQYQGKGLIGLERLLGATTDLTNELLSDLCQDTNQQGFINTTICGKPFTGTFRGANEGIQRLGDLIGFAVSENCENTTDVIDNYDFARRWAIEIKPQFELSLNVALDRKFDENFPTLSDSFSVELCDGTTPSFGYLGKGLQGVSLALNAMHRAQSAQASSYFACTQQAFYPVMQGTLRTSFCDGTDYTETYDEIGIAGLAKILDRQNRLNVIWQNRFAECLTTSTSERKYSGSFDALDCEGNNISGGYFNLPIDGVLGIMFKVLEKKIDDLCGDYQDSATFTDCEGNIINTSYQGKGYQGLQIGMKVYAITLSQIINKLCEAINPTISDSFDVDLCNGTTRNYGYLGTGFNGVKLALNAMHQAQNDQIVDYFNCLIPQLYPRYSGQFSTLDCEGNNISEIYNSTTLSETLEIMFRALARKVDDLCGNYDDSATFTDCEGNIINSSYQGKGYRGLQLGMKIYAITLSQIINKLCEKIDSIDPQNPLNNPNISGNLSAIVCGKPYNYAYGVPESALTAELVKGNLDILAKVLNDFCAKLEPEQPQPYTVFGDICGDPISYPLLVTNEGYQIAQAGVSAVSSLALKVCQEFQDLEACDPVIIMPSDKYRERVITSQMQITFYPVGTTKSQRKTSPKWRLQISNPRSGLTCADFAPLTWKRGIWLSKVLFDMGAIETYSYFDNYDPDNQAGEAVDKMLYLASLSTIPLQRPKPRVTRSNFAGVQTPNQPIIEAVRVVFTYFDSNGQQTGVECLQCKP